ncbi:hypothetical protein A7D16_01500 [Xanthomonas nasturtii]|nr:hypothetical protein [Xanthomonas nasturtii]OAX88379.1 hypothetical protein A7D16_01500 [Xanthomonas nasturtii]WVL57533.1 hypothetical protein M3O54_004245 [Xanthomonas nasturtii]
MSRSNTVALPPILPVRPEYHVALQPLDPALIAAATPARWQAPPWLRKALGLVVLVAVWEIAARVVGDDLMPPSALQTARAFYEGLLSGELLRRVGTSLRVLALGVVLAFVLTALAASTRWGRDVLGTLTAMFNPLPAIALLPRALLWFGLDTGSLVFVLGLLVEGVVFRTIEQPTVRGWGMQR